MALTSPKPNQKSAIEPLAWRDFEGDKWYLLKTIDTFADIGGDMSIFKPLHPYRKPDAATPYWNVLLDGETATARQIADYARKKGISYGCYMGCAAHGGEGNARVKELYQGNLPVSERDSPVFAARESGQCPSSALSEKEGH
jgi:hypothetical protein